MKLYHGTSQETPNGISLYMTTSLSEAKQYALGLDDLGNYNQESFIYEMDVDTTNAEIIEDFMEFDGVKYTEDINHVVFNPESGWYIVPNVVLTLIEKYRNDL